MPLRSLLLAMAASSLCACACEPLTSLPLAVAESVDFGEVEVGARIEREVAVFNPGPTDVVLERASWVKVPGPAFFSISLPEPKLIPAGGALSLPVTFEPPAPGTYVGTLVLHAAGASDENAPQVLLKGVARASADLGVGGPRVALLPSGTMNLGRVPLVPGAAARRQDRLHIFNVGAAGSVLQLLEVLAEPTDETTQEPLVPGPPATTALLAERGKFIELPVQFLPQSLGEKRWTLRVRTNDPERPEVLLSVVAEVVPPGQCKLEVSPREVRVGFASPPAYRDVAVTVRNASLGTDASCVLWDFQPPGDTTAISLPNAPKEPLLLRPNESFTLQVRSLGFVDDWYVGKATFRSSSEAVPVEEILLYGRIVGRACLTIAPDGLDFGTVRVGCTSATRTFSIYNTCSTPVTVQSFSVQAAAGQPAGGPDCPGRKPCPEFVLTQVPAIPPGGLTLHPGQGALTFQAQYAPIDLGSDTGAVAVEASAPGGPLTYVVSLQANGFDPGIHLDTFAQYPRPGSNTLLVLDTSPSMAAHQANVTSNLEWWRDYLVWSGMDANVGVLTADPADGLTLVQLNSLEPDFAAHFDAAVAVGSSGTGGRACLERAVQALSPSMRAGPNAGFLRAPYGLSVICVTDGEDESPSSAADYAAALQALAFVPRFTVLGAQTPSCPGDSGKLAGVAALTGGDALDVCSGQLSTVLGGSSNFIPYRPRYEFFLTSTPDLTLAPLDVRIDGGVATDWTYDPASNAIKFDPLQAPPPGSTLTVAYESVCYL